MRRSSVPFIRLVWIVSAATLACSDDVVPGPDDGDGDGATADLHEGDGFDYEIRVTPPGGTTTVAAEYHWDVLEITGGEIHINETVTLPFIFPTDVPDSLDVPEEPFLPIFFLTSTWDAETRLNESYTFIAYPSFEETSFDPANELHAPFWIGSSDVGAVVAIANREFMVTGQGQAEVPGSDGGTVTVATAEVTGTFEGVEFELLYDRERGVLVGGEIAADGWLTEIVPVSSNIEFGPPARRLSAGSIERLHPARSLVGYSSRRGAARRRLELVPPYWGAGQSKWSHASAFPTNSGFTAIDIAADRSTGTITGNIEAWASGPFLNLQPASARAATNGRVFDMVRMKPDSCGDPRDYDFTFEFDTDVRLNWAINESSVLDWIPAGVASGSAFAGVEAEVGSVSASQWIIALGMAFWVFRDTEPGAQGASTLQLTTTIYQQAFYPVWFRLEQVLETRAEGFAIGIPSPFPAPHIEGMLSARGVTLRRVIVEWDEDAPPLERYTGSLPSPPIWECTGEV